MGCDVAARVGVGVGSKPASETGRGVDVAARSTTAAAGDNESRAGCVFAGLAVDVIAIGVNSSAGEGVVAKAGAAETLSPRLHPPSQHKLTTSQAKAP